MMKKPKNESTTIKILKPLAKLVFFFLILILKKSTCDHVFIMKALTFHYEFTHWKTVLLSIIKTIWLVFRGKIIFSTRSTCHYYID